MTSPKFIVSMPGSGPPAPRTARRSQVPRACNWCRVHRLKCDSDFPCTNCRRKGGECNSDRLAKPVTLPQACREIDRLKQRVEQLENELQNERQKHRSVPVMETPYTPDDSPKDTTVNVTVPESASGKRWEGIYISTARSPNKTWYGSSSRSIHVKIAIFS